jgi:MinD-like ATPase involved in chromosome partitioning or flagellar assembly
VKNLSKLTKLFMTKKYLETGLKYHKSCKDLIKAHKDELPIVSMQNTLNDFTKYADQEIDRIQQELNGFKDSWLGHIIIFGVLLWIWSAFKF